MCAQAQQEKPHGGRTTRRPSFVFCFSFGRSIRSFASLALVFLTSKQRSTHIHRTHTPNTYTQHRPKLTNNHRTETCETVERYAHASLLTSSTAAREMMQTSSNQCNQSYRNQRKTGENKTSQHHPVNTEQACERFERWDVAGKWRNRRQRLGTIHGHPQPEGASFINERIYRRREVGRCTVE